ncbi:hypothetical protein [Streptomyces sioyaensis]
MQTNYPLTGADYSQREDDLAGENYLAGEGHPAGRSHRRIALIALIASTT